MYYSLLPENVWITLCDGMLDARYDFLKACHSCSQVMGFPIGGDYLSITEGVLSRIEVPFWCTFSTLRCLLGHV